MENTTTSVTPSAVAIRYGLLAGLASVIISFGLNMAELEQTPAKWLGTVILILAIVLAHKFFKQQNGGFLSYGQGLSIGTILSVVVGVISAAFSYIYIRLVDPEFVNRIMDKTRSDMEARGNMSDAQIEQAMTWTAKFMDGPLMVGTVLFMIVLTGFLASLLISAITKNPRPEFE